MAISRVKTIKALSKFKSALTSYSFGPSLLRRFSSSNVSTLLERVGFIGLGNMGFHMANNLINAGYKVCVHDINSTVMEKFSDKGVSTKETPSEVAETSDIVITMLPSSSHVLDVYTGQNGLLHGGNILTPWLFIDSSTIDPQTSRRLSATISNCALKEKKGCGGGSPVLLDAPVSGGVLGAEAGTLTFMVGGLREAYLAAEPIFLSMGKHTIYCGGTGNGVAYVWNGNIKLNSISHSGFSCLQAYTTNYAQQCENINSPYLLNVAKAAKICNNLAMAVSMLGVSEAVSLGQSLGITASTLTKIFNSSSARCWSSDSYNPVPGVMEGVPASRNYDGGFSSKLMEKDLNLAVASAEEVSLKCPMTSQAQAIYMGLCKEGHESKDFSCVFRHYYSGKDEL